MQRITNVERLDALATLGILIGLGFKSTLKPGIGVFFMVLCVLAVVWFFSRTVRAIQGQDRGLQRLWKMVVVLGATFNSFAILWNTNGWGGADNVSALGALTGLGWLAWLRLEDKPARQAPNRVIAYVAPLLVAVSMVLWFCPSDVRYRTFRPESPYVSWEQFRHGTHIQDGYIVDSTGKKLEPVEFRR